MHPKVLLNLPVSKPKARDLPPHAGSLVVRFDDDSDAGGTLKWFSDLLANVFHDNAFARPINLWSPASKVLHALEASSVRASLTARGREQFVSAHCKSASDLRAALTVIWPQAEAVVFYQPLLAEDEEALITQVHKSWAPYEGRFASQLDKYHLFAFMEEGRLSLEFIGEAHRLLEVLVIVVDKWQPTARP